MGLIAESNRLLAGLQLRLENMFVFLRISIELDNERYESEIKNYQSESRDSAPTRAWGCNKPKTRMKERQCKYTVWVFD